MTDLDKERLVNAFLRGESVTDLSAFYAVYKASVEDVLREAILGLSRLNQSLAAQPFQAPPQRESMDGLVQVTVNDSRSIDIPGPPCEHCGQPDPHQDHFDAWTADLPQGGWTCEAPASTTENA